MSNQPPPSFGDHRSYAQQWPPFYPSMVPPGFLTGTDIPPTGQAPPMNPGHQFPFNTGGFEGGSQIPAGGGQGVPGLFFPPLPFMPQMNQPQLSSAPFPLPVPPGFAYPPVPSPGSSNLPPAPFHTNETPSNQHQVQGPAAFIPSDPCREEGEVSEVESAPYSPPANDGQGIDHTSTRHPELEEHATPTSPYSSRSSSPYNPPLSVSADHNVVDRAIELQKQDARTPGTSDDSQSPRSAIQLRVQAQGALLSLAPHNIRYNELIAEGIKPAVLKELYAEVGLKIPVQPEIPIESTAPTITPPHAPVNKPSATSAGPRTQFETVPPTKKVLPQEPRLPVSPSTAKPNAAKPMERKEVIARMLAAKAAKASEASASKIEPKEVQAPASETATAIPPGVIQGKEKAVPVREKNKAQTELARQRIEELKRQALLRSQQKAQKPCQPTPASNSGEIASEPSTPAVQHPLPVRPPIPQSSSTDAIPGLSMTGLQKNTEHAIFPAITPGITIDSTPVVRASQRKRPHAADFDEPASLPKRPSSHSVPQTGAPEKLIIDISDEESLYGDDEGDTMDVDSGHEQDLGLIGVINSTGVPSQVDISTTRASTSTPQGLSRSNDQEHIQKRNMEIQAMHRKIAELEERRKAKVAASRAGSPHFLNGSSTSSSAVRLSPVDPGATEAMSDPVSRSMVAADTDTTMEFLPKRPSLIDSFSESSVKVLASMDMAQLDSIRLKILRMRDIESGLPSLEVEISSSESRLNSCKQEAERLLFEITKGKEGRLQLIEELKNLSYEINGLTLENLDELHRQAEARQQHLLAKEVTCDNNVSGMEDSIMSDGPPSTAEAVRTKLAASESEVDSPETASSQSEGNLDVVEPPPPSRSDSGSSMDESVESSSDESSDVEYSPLPDVAMTSNGPPADSTCMPDRAAPVVDESLSGIKTGQSPFNKRGLSISERPSPNKHSRAEQKQAVVDSGLPPTTSITAYDLEHPLHGRPQAPVTDNTSNDQAHRAHREPSAESDAYEPPEPGTGTDPFDSAYSPRFSPVPPGPVEDAAAPLHPSDRPYPDEPLTHAHQALIQESRRNTQKIVLDDEEPFTHIEPKFTSYVSPLRHFKAYRYHPSYAEDIPGGYRSLTYSHNIDPMKHLCPFELAGGVCNDRSCDFQHFRDMNLSDDKILIQMGAVREGQTDDEKDNYIVGLKAMINEMRRDKVKDFSIVANEIAAYRRRFLQDPSRVLPL